MWKLLGTVLLEVIVGISLAGVILAVAVPAMIRLHWLSPGDTTGSIVIGGVLLGSIAIAVLRPGSALRRGEKA